MSTKMNPGEWDCYANALPDEPMIILLARDLDAPDLTRDWVGRKRKRLLSSVEDNVEGLPPEVRADLRKCSNAEEVAHDMMVWRKNNEGAWRVSPADRDPATGIEPALQEEIARQTKASLCRLLMVGGAQVRQAEHKVNRWSMPGFAVWRNYFRFEADDPHFERLIGTINPALPEFSLSGYDANLGDVLCRAKSPIDLRLEIQIVGGGRPG